MSIDDSQNQRQMMRYANANPETQPNIMKDEKDELINDLQDYLND